MTGSSSEDDAKLITENHAKCVNKFLDVANAMKDEGIEPGPISHALMAASGVYATYAVVGNSGGLTQSGVDKLVSIYRGSLEDIQKTRKEQQRQD